MLSHNALFWNIKISFYNSGLRSNDLFTSQEKFCSRSICKRNRWSELCEKLWTSRFHMAVCSIVESAFFQLCHECLKNCALWRVCKSLLIWFSGKRQRMFLLFFSQTESSLDASVVPCEALRLKGMTSLSDDSAVVLDTTVCDWRFEGKNTILYGSKLGHGVYVKPGPGFPYMVLYMLVGSNNEAKVLCCLPSKEVKNSLMCTLTPVM